jgi:hypothetical protein
MFQTKAVDNEDLFMSFIMFFTIVMRYSPLGAYFKRFKYILTHKRVTPCMVTDADEFCIFHVCEEGNVTPSLSKHRRLLRAKAF